MWLNVNRKIETPAFIYNEEKILSNLQVLNKIKNVTNCKILFSLKSFSIIEALKLIALHVDGFSASSLFEARIADELLGDHQTVHISTPGLRSDEIDDISKLCDYISFNSTSQWEKYHKKVEDKVSCGLRINPQISFIQDDRYNPCRKNSKLGVALTKLIEISKNGIGPLKLIKGLHFHTNCESTDYSQLHRTVRHIDVHLSKILDRVEWINLGGGYLFDENDNLDDFCDVIAFLRKRYGMDTFIEPGKSVVGNAGYIVATVLDIFESEGKVIAVLDTTVNHMPEVFEYQYQPDIMEESEDGRFKYLLAGTTCLAGDLFGEYAFDEPLEVGSQIVFKDVGAYSLVKSNMFNGVKLPNIYRYTQDRQLELKKQFGYKEFISMCGV